MWKNVHHMERNVEKLEEHKVSRILGLLKSGEPLLLWFECYKLSEYQSMMLYEFKLNKLSKDKRWKWNKKEKDINPLKNLHIFSEREAKILAEKVKNSKSIDRIEKLLGVQNE